MSKKQEFASADAAVISKWIEELENEEHDKVISNGESEKVNNLDDQNTEVEYYVEPVIVNVDVQSFSLVQTESNHELMDVVVEENVIHQVVEIEEDTLIKITENHHLTINEECDKNSNYCSSNASSDDFDGDPDFHVDSDSSSSDSNSIEGEFQSY